MYATQTSSSPIETVVHTILSTQQITRLEQQRFMMAALSNRLPPSDRVAINRVFDALQRGILQVVD